MKNDNNYLHAHKKSLPAVRPARFSTGGDVVIRFEDVSKMYRLGTINHGTLINDVQSWWARMRGLEDPNARINDDAGRLSTDRKNDGTFWALKDIFCDVYRGDVLGIIGRNGAGKSTLLKILSQVTTPTRGQIKVNGRIASLLEVGTGFHPELTGRENVFLNGAILGMSKSEVSGKFEEIVEFAEIERFIDTPVKRYSSGMYVRLAFAVAAHLEPDILVVDEVLAVGDTVFNRKCIDKISEVNRQGRTVLFVSHNLSLVNSLCNKGIILREGQLVFSGGAREAVDRYIDEGAIEERVVNLENIHRKEGAQELTFASLKFEDFPIRFGKKIMLSLSLRNKLVGSRHTGIDFGLAICDRERKRLIHCSNRFLGLEFIHEDDSASYFFEIDNPLKPGDYYITLFLRSNNIIQDWLVDIVRFNIEEGNPYGFYDCEQITGSIFPIFNMYIK